jgi:hypothetical protein
MMYVQQEAATLAILPGFIPLMFHPTESRIVAVLDWGATPSVAASSRINKTGQKG